MQAARRRAAETVLIVGLTLSVIPASAGLFGSIGNALGIGGDVGKALNFADGFLPGGGGPTDAILGAPGKAAFGEAIKKWGDVNDRSIEKLGETNDRTVAKLLQGLEKVVATLDAGLTSNVEAIDAALATSIASLDDSLERNLEKFDNSLSDQTLRLDTVFQKQTSTLFFFGRVILTVLILGGFVFSAYRVVLASPDLQSLSQFLRRRRAPVVAAASIAAVTLALTWLVPDPGRLRLLEQRYVKTYDRALRLEDFSSAQNSAAQLTVLRPDSALYRSWSIKALAFRDLVSRPTLLTADDRVHGLYVRLGQVNEYRKEEALAEDSDVLVAYALVNGIRAKRELDYVSTTIALSSALKPSSDVNDHSIEHLRGIAESARAQFRSLTIPSDLLTFALSSGGANPEKGDDRETDGGRRAFLDEYAKATRNAAEESNRDVAGPISSSSLSSFGELSNALHQKVVIRLYYRGLTAKYFALLEAQARAAAPGASAQDQNAVVSAYCAMHVYNRDWHREAFPKYGGSLSFVSSLLSGPFTLTARAKPLVKPAPNACNGINDAAIDQQLDIANQWLTPLVALKLQQSGKGAVLLKTAAKLSAERQNSAFAEYEKQFAQMKDIQDRNVSGIADSAVRSARAEVVISLAELSAILGLYSELDGAVVPAVHQLRLRYSTSGVVPDDRWRQASRAFLESRFGA